MKKVIALVLVLTYLLGLSSCASKPDNPTSLIELEEVSAFVSEKAYEGEDFKENLVGQCREDIIHLWGKPDGRLSGFWGEYWYLDDRNYRFITLYYDEHAYVENIVVGMNTAEANNTENGDLVPMVMVNGSLYLDTGYESTAVERYDAFDGEITSAVDSSENPTDNNQSNFGTGYGYQYGKTEGTIEIYMNGKWWIFATEKVKREMQFSKEEANHSNVVNIIGLTKGSVIGVDAAEKKFYEDENNEYYFNESKSQYVIVEYEDGRPETVKGFLELVGITIAG